MTRASGQAPPPRGKGISPVTSRGWHDYSAYRGRDAQPSPREIVARLREVIAARSGDTTTTDPEQNGENA